MTIFKVPGFYDQNNYLKSFVARFGVFHRIYKKTLHTRFGKSFGGPNVIVQYTTLFELPPTRIVLDGRYSLHVYWSMPSPDIVHPENRLNFQKQIMESKGPPKGRGRQGGPQSRQEPSTTRRVKPKIKSRQNLKCEYIPKRKQPQACQS